MASIDVDVGGRRYSVACRDGEEEHLRALAAMLDKRAADAIRALGGLSEARLLLFSALMIADDLYEARNGGGGGGGGERLDIAAPLERLAQRVEALAERLEKSAPNP